MTIFYAYDFEKRDAVYPKLKFKQNLKHALHNMEKGELWSIYYYQLLGF